MKLMLFCLFLTGCTVITKPSVFDVPREPCAELPKLPMGADQAVVTAHHVLLIDLYAKCASRE